MLLKNIVLTFHVSSIYVFQRETYFSMNVMPPLETKPLNYAKPSAFQPSYYSSPVDRCSAAAVAPAVANSMGAAPESENSYAKVPGIPIHSLISKSEIQKILS